MPGSHGEAPADPRPAVILIEDQPGTRLALTQALELGGFRIAGAFETGESALEESEALSAEVALVDLGLPGISGLEVIRRLRQRQPGISILVLTVFDDAPRVVEAIEAGAQGYLLKDTPMSQVAAAVAAVRAGHAPLSPEIAGHLLTRLRSDRAPAALCGLSQREVEVISLLARGHAYADIATALGIQLSTVQSHVRNIYRKLEVSSKAEAAVVAVRNGIVKD
ncbi:MAG TPA: response regulator transcription factor [Anaeromyxobacter sp.]|nr:response regulator transcription factor [Anaeromyxobacter sp.]